MLSKTPLYTVKLGRVLGSHEKVCRKMRARSTRARARTIGRKRRTSRGRDAWAHPRRSEHARARRRTFARSGACARANARQRPHKGGRGALASALPPMTFGCARARRRPFARSGACARTGMPNRARTVNLCKLCSLHLIIDNIVSRFTYIH